ncbi:MAG TPA: cupredoxin domain-containing protein [Gaiellaceae bacterium]
MSRIRIALAGFLALAVLGVAAGSALAASGTFTAAKRKHAVVKPTVVTVKASEFKFVLSKKSITKPGKVTFKVTNVGKEPHNFVVLSGINKGTKLILPHKTASLTLTFKKKGHYTYECTVGEHAEEGMLGTFIVK